MEQMTRCIWVPGGALRYLERLLAKEPMGQEDCLLENETVTYTASFGSGMEMDVKVCGVHYREGESNRAWSEAVLFEYGKEVAFTGPGDYIRGRWSIPYKGVEYTTLIRKKRSRKGPALRRFLRWINQ